MISFLQATTLRKELCLSTMSFLTSPKSIMIRRGRRSKILENKSLMGIRHYSLHSRRLDVSLTISTLCILIFNAQLLTRLTHLPSNGFFPWIFYKFYFRSNSKEKERTKKPKVLNGYLGASLREFKSFGSPRLDCTSTSGEGSLD